MADWEEHKIGPWSFKSIQNPEDLRNHMKEALAIAKKFRKDIDDVNENIRCPVGVLASKSKPTLEKIIQCKRGLDAPGRSFSASMTLFFMIFHHIPSSGIL